VLGLALEETLANALRSLPVGPETLPVLDVEAMLRRMPAEARASVAWAKKPIADGHLREAMTAEEWTTVQRARMGNLR